MYCRDFLPDWENMDIKKTKPRWAIRRLKRKSFWFDVWKPTWHNGRGYYVTIGLWWFAIYRGY